MVVLLFALNQEPSRRSGAMLLAQKTSLSSPPEPETNAGKPAVESASAGRTRCPKTSRRFRDGSENLASKGSVPFVVGGARRPRPQGVVSLRELVPVSRSIASNRPAETLVSFHHLHGSLASRHGQRYLPSVRDLRTARAKARTMLASNVFPSGSRHLPQSRAPAVLVFSGLSSSPARS